MEGILPGTSTRAELVQLPSDSNYRRKSSGCPAIPLCVYVPVTMARERSFGKIWSMGRSVSLDFLFAVLFHGADCFARMEDVLPLRPELHQ